MPTDTPPPRPDIEGFLLSSRMPTAKDLHGLAYELEAELAKMVEEE